MHELRRTRSHANTAHDQDLVESGREGIHSESRGSLAASGDKAKVVDCGHGSVDRNVGGYFVAF